SLVATYNLLVVAGPALTVLAVAALAREITGDACASIAAGLVATLNAIAVWSLPVLHVSCGYLIAALLWAVWRMHRLQRARDVALALALFTALVFASQEYAMIALALVGIDTVCRLLAPHALGLERRWMAGMAAWWAIVAAGLGTLVAFALALPA